jgi:hypothetical protein
VQRSTEVPSYAAALELEMRAAAVIALDR